MKDHNIDMMNLVLEKLSEFLGRPITEEDLAKGYDSLGADSMDMVALAFEIERATGIKILPEIFLQHVSIKSALEQILSGKDT